MRHCLLSFLVLTLSSVSLYGQDGDRARSQLTTLFASNNGYAGNMFDIEPKLSLPEIWAIDVNVSSVGEPLEIEVYYKLGTCVGYDRDPTAWTLLGTFHGTSAGQDLPSYIDMAGNGKPWIAGQLYGVYIHLENYSIISGILRYTNGGPNVYENDELRLTTYYGKADPAFYGTTYKFRQWNGTIYYGTVAPTLTVTPSSIDMTVGGAATFSLDAGPQNAGRAFGVFGSVTGTAPGTPLPGGLAVLPINWDVYTDLLLTLASLGHPYTPLFGNLDGSGKATVVVTFPAYPLPAPAATYYAFCLNNPFDFASQAVQLDLY